MKREFLKEFNSEFLSFVEELEKKYSKDKNEAS